MDKPFSKELALKFMFRGYKVTHDYFSTNEWMTINTDGEIVLEDGVKCSIEDFFFVRNGEGWNHGYTLYLQ